MKFSPLFHFQLYNLLSRWFNKLTMKLNRNLQGKTSLSPSPDDNDSGSIKDWSSGSEKRDN